MAPERASGFEGSREISKESDKERAKVAENLLRDFLALQKNERVTFIIDQLKKNTDPQLIQILQDAVKNQGAKFDTFDVTSKTTPAQLEKAVTNSNVAWVSWDFSTEKADWDAFMEVVEKQGIKMAYSPGLKVDSLDEGGALTEDLETLENTLGKMDLRLKGMAGMHVSSSYGSDLWVKLLPDVRRWAKDSGVIEPGHFDNLPGGEIFTTPDEEGVNGRLVLPVLLDDITLDQGVDEFVYLTIRNGKIAKIDGGKSAEKLRKFLQESSKDEKDPEAVLQVAEIAFGANSKARTVVSKPEGSYQAHGRPSVETEKRLGTMHFAFGDTRHGEEGTEGHTEADMHLDFVLPRAGLTVTAFKGREDFEKRKNGERLIDEGRWNFY